MKSTMMVVDIRLLTKKVGVYWIPGQALYGAGCTRKMKMMENGRLLIQLSLKAFNLNKVVVVGILVYFAVFLYIALAP